MERRRLRQSATTLLAAATLGAATAGHAGDRWVIDDEHFSIMFAVSHGGFQQQLGMFLEAEGEFVYDEEADELHAGSVAVYSDSVFSNHEGRDDHLRDRDFLDADNHPTITFEATGYDPTAGKLYGDFTLLGTTRPIALDVEVNRVGEYPFGAGLFRSPPYVLGASVRGTIRRSEYGMTYGIEDEMVGDEVGITIEFEARREQ